MCRFACKGQMLTPGLFFYFSSYVQRQGFSIESRVCQFGQGVTLPCFCLLSLLGHTSLVLKWVWGFQVHSSHLCGKPFWLSLLSIPLLLLWMCFIIQLMDQYILLVYTSMKQKEQILKFPASNPTFCSNSGSKIGYQRPNLRTTHRVLGQKHFDNVKHYSLTLKCPPQVHSLIICHLAGGIVLEP